MSLCFNNWQSLHNVRCFKMLQIQNHSYQSQLVSLHFSPILPSPPHPCRILSLKQIDMNFLRGEECLRLVLVHFSFVESHVVRGGPPLDPHRRTGRQFCALGAEAGLLLARLLLRPRKTGNWQPGNWPRVEHLDKLVVKRPQEEEKTCVRLESWTATELVGAAGVCCLSTALQITPQQYHSSRQQKARTSENYRTPLARDNPSIRGGGRLVSGSLSADDA